MELRFAAAMNGNPVDKFLAVNGDVFTVTGSTNEALCTYTGILSSNIAVSSTVITASTVVAGTNTCGARRVSQRNEKQFEHHLKRNQLAWVKCLFKATDRIIPTWLQIFLCIY